MAGYYDYVLGVIPAVMVLPILTAFALGVSVPMAVIAGGAGSIPLIGHAMFVRGPGGDETTESATQTTPTTTSTDAPAPAAD